MAAVDGVNICLRKFDDSTIYREIKRHGVTHVWSAVVLNMLASSSDTEPLKNQIQILTTGAPPSASVLFRTESLGFTVSHGYGLTKTAGLVVS
ncbi:acyl-activating enzyme 5 peroxisomal [Tripterygium wilfordii]|uniref:Acyl-activating enzyme 5 peroxisomal n=1 Tax=Tripterygium wilfordii TaxID=458696 RepID=A0A7J7DZ78_TRIWF|nr:acyl-activating enzyme 5 peroxisomal [Tripterygium wilfordii]